MNTLGRLTSLRILDAFGIPETNVRNVRISIKANLDEATMATIEVDRFVTKEEEDALVALLNEVQPEIIERKIEPPTFAGGYADVSDVTMEYRKFTREYGSD